MDDDTIRTLVTRLSRPHNSGGEVIERAAILAEGSDSAAVLAWIAARGAVPEEQAPLISRRGLHSARLTETAAAASGTPRRYVLPPGALSREIAITSATACASASRSAAAHSGCTGPETANPSASCAERDARG
jgi:hypothetical protein